MKKRTYLLIGILVLFALCMHSGSASALGFEAAVGYWQQNPSGDFAYEPVSALDRLDIEDNLGYDKKNRPNARVKLDLPLFLPNVYLMATPMRFKGSGDVGTVNIGGTRFTGVLDSELQMDQYDIGLYYSIPFLNTATIGKLNAEFGIDVKIIDFSFTGTGTEDITNNTVTVSESATVPLPLIYVAVQLKPVKAFSIEAEGRGIAYSGNHFYDVIGRVKVKPIGPVFISGGYRYQQIKVDESDVEVDIKVSGPFIEVGVEI